MWVVVGSTLPLGETLDYLEATPYWDQSTVPPPSSNVSICAETRDLNPDSDEFQHK